MKKIFLALLLLINATAFSQVIVNRAGPANTVIDQRLGGARNFILPRYNTLALADADLGLDLCGALIYCLEDNSIYHRQCSPKAWVKMGSSANGGNGVCGLQSGGLVTWSGTGLAYDVTSAAYCINSNGYYFGGGQITLDAAPTTNNRFDVLALDNTGSLVKITGTENVNPQVPSINPATQIYLTAILVTPGGGAGTQKVIWDENTGAPEWTATATGNWTSTNFNSTTTPYHGSIVTNGTGADGIYLTGGSGFRYADAIGITANDYNSLKFFIKNKQPVSFSGNITIVLVTDNNGTGNKIPINLSQSFGYNKTDTDWQNITIPLTNFGVFAPGEKINRIELRYYNYNDLELIDGFLVDYITMQGGVNNPGTGGNFVTNVFRVPGTDSIFQKINGVDYFAHLDSVGGGSIPTLQQVTAAGNITVDTVTVRRLVSTKDALVNNIAVGVGGNGSFGPYGMVIGQEALQSMTGNNSDIAIGGRALQVHTAANTYNVAIGYGTMRTDTNSVQNTVLGTASLANTRLVSNLNTSIGYEAMKALTGLTAYNVALGGQALHGTTGNIGFPAALNSSDTVRYNVALGYGSGRGIIKGSKNIFIGTLAGRSAANRTNINNNISIGYDAGYNENNSDRLHIASPTKTIIGARLDSGQVVINPITNANIVFNPNVAFEVKAFNNNQVAIPFPLMTEAQRLLIPVAATLVGGHVYQTDGTEGVYIYKSTGWVLAY